MDQVLPHNQVLRTSAARLQGKGLIVTWTLCKGAAAKGTFLRHSMEELLPKDRNSRAVQMFGADGRAQLSRNRENDPLV